jgi:hypothetical protein
MQRAFAPENSDGPDRVAFTALLALVVAQPVLASVGVPVWSNALTPWPLGGMLLNVSTFLIAALALISRSASLNLQPLRVPIRALVGVTVFGATQLLPLPEGVLDQFAPVNLKIYHETALILKPFRLSAPLPRISIAPGATASSLLQLSAGILLMIAAVSLLRTRARRRLFGGIVALSALLQASLLVGRDALRVGSAPSPLPDPVSLAVWLGIGLMVTFGSFWAEVLTGEERGADTPDAAERLERRVSPAAFRAVVWLAIAAAVIATRVPAALVSALAATLFLLGLAFGRRRRDLARFGAALLVVILLGATIGAAAPGDDETGGRTARPQEIWRTSIETWKQFPYLGSGLGTFPEAFRRVQPRTLPDLVDRARSAPLELLVTGGVVGFALGALGVLSLLACLFRAWRAQRHREESAIALAAFGALLFWILSGLVESSSHSLATLPLLAPVVGAGWAASQARGGRIA